MSHVWQAGMEAVFVGWPDGFLWREGDPVLRENAIYVVEGVTLFPRGTMVTTIRGDLRVLPADFVYLRINGQNAISLGFRPVQKRETSIEVFHEIYRKAAKVVKREVKA